MQSHANDVARAHAGIDVARAHAGIATTFCFMQNHANGVDVGVQLLDPPDRALCTDRRQAAASATVCGGYECHQAFAAAVLLWLPQKRHETPSKPSVLLHLGRLAFPSGMVNLHFAANSLPCCTARSCLECGPYLVASSPCCCQTAETYPAGCCLIAMLLPACCTAWCSLYWSSSFALLKWLSLHCSQRTAQVSLNALLLVLHCCTA